MAMTRGACVLALVLVACSPSRKAGDDQGADALIECMVEGAHRCQGASYQTCAGGLWQTAIDCPQACIDSLGCVQCPPSQTFCKDGDVWSCNDQGNPDSLVMACTGANTCVGGACVDACADAAASKSYIGCEYWAVDLDNAIEVWGAIGESLGFGLTLNAQFCTSQYRGTVTTMPICTRMQGQNLYSAGACDPPATMGGALRCPTNFTCATQQACVSDAQHSPFAIVVSNPHAKDVNVIVTGPSGQTINRTITAGQVASILPQMNNAIPDQSVDGSSKAQRAYKITSDLPIVAYQFNPLDNVDVFSNDASLLIPTTAFDADYYVMSYPTLDRRASTSSKDRYHSYLTIVAAKDSTQIEVTPSAATNASATNSTIAAGATVTFTLDAHEVLQLQASGAGDLTGTHVTSPNMMPFGVFSGHEATGYGEMTPPDSTHFVGPCCADHLEEMLFPSTTWGKAFAISRSQQRTNEPDMLRILAQKPNTTLTFTPAPAAGTCGALGPGQFCEVKIMDDTEITATEPVLIGHYLQSSMWRDSPVVGAYDWVGTGDPSMAIAVPTEQFRKDYTILVPAQYEQSYVSIAAPATGGVLVDGQMVNLAPFPGGGTHRAARVPLAAGQHKITCADGCGITVYGYSDAVSYMFAGGLDLKPLVIL